MGKRLGDEAETIRWLLALAFAWLLLTTIGHGSALAAEPSAVSAENGAGGAPPTRLALIESALKRHEQSSEVAPGIGANHRALGDDRTKPPDPGPGPTGTMKFEIDERYDLPARPSDVRLADIDADGDVDIVTLTESGVIVLFKNDSGFSAPTAVPLPVLPSGFAIADIDGDEHPELLVGRADTRTLSVYAWNDGTPAEIGSYPIYMIPNVIEAFDADGDGDLDVAVAGTGSYIMVFRNDGTGSLAHTTTREVNSPFPADGEMQLTAANMDQDHIPDLVAVGDSRRTIAVFPGRGDCTYRVPFVVTTPWRSIDLAVGDMDGDGDLDVATAWENNAQVFRNDGTGQLSYVADINTRFIDCFGVALADLDGDGRDELLMTDYTMDSYRREGSRVDVYENAFASDQTNSRDFVTGFGPVAVAVGDVDNDGLPDVVTANYGKHGNSFPPPSVSILYNRGWGILGSFFDILIPKLPPPASPVPGGIRVVRRNGLPDLVAAYQGPPLLFKSNGHGDFLAPVPMPEGFPKFVRDLDGDGDDDLVTDAGAGDYQVWIGDGQGQFVAAGTLDRGILTLIDFDGDPLIDAVDLLPTHELAVRRNVGGGIFGQPEPLGIVIPPGDSPYGNSTLTAANLDGEPGDELMLALDGPAFADTLIVWRNKKGHGFSDPLRVVGVGVPTTYFYESRPSQIISADFNADGNMDIAVMGQYGDFFGAMSVFLNQRAGRSWTAMPAFHAGSECRDFVVADFDLDGYPDLAVADANTEDPGGTIVHHGRGDGTFETLPTLFPGNNPGGIVSADFDNDGRPDLALLCLREGTIAIHRNVSVTPAPRHVVAFVESASAEGGHVRVEWSVPGVLAAAVERSDHGNHWAPYGSTTLLPSGNLAFEDAAVESGRRYGYRLVSKDPLIAIDDSEAWVKLMPHGGVRVSAVALPSADGNTLSLSLETTDPGDADIDVFDLGGRRVASRRVVGLSVGAHTITLSRAAELGQGIYWVRVRQREQSVVRKVVVTR
jgi:FG-GAP-like repeat